MTGPQDMAAKVGRYIERLQITQGPAAGERFELLPYQSEFLGLLFGPDVEIAVLSVPRGNGKTAFAAAIGTAAVNGPLRQPRGTCVTVASSFQQARLAWDDSLAYLGRQALSSRQTWRVLDTTGQAVIEHRYSGARLQAIASDPRRMHGLRPSLVLADEPAQWIKPEEAFAALQTSAGKLPGCLILLVGTRAADDIHFFERMRAEADNPDNPAVVGLTFSGDPTAPLFDDSGEIAQHVKDANPAWDHFPELRGAIVKEAKLAARDSTARRTFNAYRLNCGASEIGRDLLLDLATFAEIERAEAELPAASGPCVWGLDLSSAYAMTAAAACWPQTGRVDYLAAFPRYPSLAERGERDSCGDAYQRMAEDGDLQLHGSRTVDLDSFLAELADRWGDPAAVAGDRFRGAELLDGLAAIGVGPDRFVSRGMGWQDGAADVSDFRLAAISRAIRVRQSYAMRHALGAAEVLESPTGDWKLAKRRKGHGSKAGVRDDLAVAMVLGVAHATRGQRSGAPAELSYAGHGEI